MAVSEAALQLKGRLQSATGSCQLALEDCLFVQQKQTAIVLEQRIIITTFHDMP